MLDQKTLALFTISCSLSLDVSERVGWCVLEVLFFVPSSIGRCFVARSRSLRLSLSRVSCRESRELHLLLAYLEIRQDIAVVVECTNLKMSGPLVDDRDDRDDRIKLSIGTKQQGHADGLFNTPRGLAFDPHQGLLFVVDTDNHRVQVLSCVDDGFSFVSKLGEEGDQPGQLQNPWAVAIDHDHDRILIVDSSNHRVQSWSLSDQSLLSCIGHHGSREFQLKHPRGIAIDKHLHRIIITDSCNHRLVFLSSVDLSFLFEIGQQGNRLGECPYPSGIAIDDDRHRIIVSDTSNHRVQVLSLIDGSFLFEFGSQGNQPGQFSHPQAVCMANQGRIIVADAGNNRLQAFTHEGHHISSFDCGREWPSGVSFDEHRGLIAFSADHQVHVIGANQWLPDSEFTWRVDRHRYAPKSIKQVVLTMTMIRSLVDESAMSMIPNELLFEIFAYLEPLEPRPRSTPKSTSNCIAM